MEDQITKYYLIQSSDKVLKYCDIFEIVSLLEHNELEGQSYVFDLRLRKWCTVESIRVLKDTNYKFTPSTPRDCPSFTPPHKLPVGEFSSGRDSDYDYLLKHMKSLGEGTSNTIHSNEDLLSSELEKISCDLNEKSSELLSSKSLILDLEDIIRSLKAEIKDSNKSQVDLEGENLQLVEQISEIKHSADRSINVARAEFENEIRQSDEIKKLNFKLTERNKTLAYALKLEKSQKEELRSLLNHKDEQSSKTSYSEELLSKTMEYFLHGPVGGEKELLEKKVQLLTSELKEREDYFNLKIQKIKREFEEDSQTVSKNLEISHQGSESLIQQRDEFEYKYKSTLDKNQVLINKVEELEESAKLTKAISDEEEDFKSKYINLANKHKKLEKSYSTLSSKNSETKIDDSATKYLKEELVKSREEVEILRKSLNKISAENSSFKDQVSGVAKSDKKLNKVIANLRSDNKQVIERFHSLKKKFEKYKVAYNDLSESNKKIKSEFKERNDKFRAMTAKTDAIIDSLRAKVDGASSNYSEKIKELEEVKDREKTLMFKIEQFKKDESEIKKKAEDQELSLATEAMESKDKELKRLIGDSFEVPNTSIWSIQNSDKVVTGPITFSEIYHMKINGELDGDVKIKKGSDPYKSKADIFELSVPVLTHGEGEDIRYFINRTSMRVPFYELITFEVNGVEHRGYCTSLSVGGVFLELTSLNDEFALDKKGRVLFSAGAIDNPFQCVAQIKNVSESRPKGLGLMFVDLPDQAKTDIEFYINNYINKTQQAA